MDQSKTFEIGDKVRMSDGMGGEVSGTVFQKAGETRLIVNVNQPGHVLHEKEYMTRISNCRPEPEKQEKRKLSVFRDAEKERRIDNGQEMKRDNDARSARGGSLETPSRAAHGSHMENRL